MPLSPKLELRQSQSLVMTPQLMQAIKLLQLSHVDLLAYVDAELERNPLLEKDEASDDAAPLSNGNGNGDGAADDSATEDGAFDVDLTNVYPDEVAPSPDETPPALPTESWASAPSRQPVSSEDYNLEAFIAEEKSLADHLGEQLGLAIADPALRLVGRAIIDEIDDAGYLRAPLDAIAERLGAPLAIAERALHIIQGFDPNGVGARDLAECLAIQLAERDRLDPAMRTLLAHLELVARRDFAALRRICGVDDEDITEMLAEIRALNPKPGHAYGAIRVEPVIPDVLVRAGPDGSWLVELNSATLPRVLVNQSYYATIARKPRSNGDRAYIVDCLQTANWLVKSLDQRARTILKVASEIIRQQDAFLAEGVAHLRPLNLKTVADAIGMHESTVSRVTSNKYLATPRGIFELKYFFTASIAAAGGGEAHSAEAVRYRIRKLIDEEPAGDILSDDAIVGLLHASGVDIARRTVAKYRESMRIPSSVRRRREKQASV